MTPAVMPKTELLELLQFVKERVEADDSMEGSLQYSWSSIGDDKFEVLASIRFDNLNGQGSIRLIGKVE